MAATKEIRTKIKSIQNTQKITRAMEMVAASKMRRAQERVACSKPYASQIRKVISHVAKAQPEYKHIYMEERDPKRVGFIIISTDRGLCGGLNGNLFKLAIVAMKEWQQKGAEVKLCLMGSKAETFFRRYGNQVMASVGHFGDAPTVSELIGGVKVMLNAYERGDIDRLFVCGNEFINTMTQKPSTEQLLPLPVFENDSHEYPWVYLYEPDAKELLNELLTRYIESQVYQAVVENIACEQAARMVAMKAASDNAGDLINEFKLIYNKARQAAITQELSEIVSGAAAV